MTLVRKAAPSRLSLPDFPRQCQGGGVTRGVASMTVSAAIALDCSGAAVVDDCCDLW